MLGPKIPMPRKKTSPGSEQLGLFDPPAEGWWLCEEGGARVYVVATSARVAGERAVEELRDLGVLPGGPPGLHESFSRMADAARRGRR